MRDREIDAAQARERAYEAMLALANGQHGLAAGLLAGLAAGGDAEAIDALAAVAGGRWRPAIDLLARLAQTSAEVGAAECAVSFESCGPALRAADEDLAGSEAMKAKAQRSPRRKPAATPNPAEAKAIETAARAVVTEMWASKSRGSTLGIREVALAIEERCPDVTLEQIHAALLRVAVLYPCENPADPRLARQLSFAWIPPGAPESLARVWVAPTTLEERIRAAYLRVTGGALNEYVKLALLREQLHGEPVEAVDAVLRAMQQGGVAVLYPIDDPQRLRPTDAAAAIRVAGERRDLLCIKR